MLRGQEKWTIFVHISILEIMRRRLKARVSGALLILLVMLCGCTGMVQEELAETHAKLAALQEQVALANESLNALEAILSKLDATHTIDPVSLKETEDGYEVSFMDGKKIFIPYGKDGSDGRTLIPVGVKLDEDGLYYWTVDGEWLLDADGNKMRAGATDGADGADGVMPQIKVEDGFWWIVFEGEDPIKIASCEEVDGVGIFSGVDLTDPSKLVLTLVDGTVLEIPRETSLKVSFAGPVMDTVLIAGGELLPIPYEVLVEGGSGQPAVVTSGTDGTYISRLVAGEEPGKGIVLVQAPDVFSEGYIILSADCDGYSAVKMISFLERQMSPAADTVTVRMGSGSDTLSVAFSANFEYIVSGCDSTWLQVSQDTVSNEALVFVSEPNTADTVRTCTVTVSPKDNPGFVCKTFVVMQASEADKTVTIDDSELPDGFSLVQTASDRLTLNAPAEGGEAVIWINTGRNVVKESNDLDWFTSVLEPNSFYNKLIVTVQANESETERLADYNAEDKTDDRIKVSIGGIMVAITVKQAGKAAEESGE